jgi:hypothetical protein
VSFSWTGARQGSTAAWITRLFIEMRRKLSGLPEQFLSALKQKGREVDISVKHSLHLTVG